MKYFLFILFLFPSLLFSQKIIVENGDTLAVVPIKAIQKANLCFNKVNYLEDVIKLTQDELKLCYDSNKYMAEIETERLAQIDKYQRLLIDMEKELNYKLKKQKKAKWIAILSGIASVITLILIK